MWHFGKALVFRAVIICAVIICAVTMGTFSNPCVTAADEPTAQRPGTWPVARLKADVPKFRVVDDKGPIHSIIYSGETINGEPTEVFAFYASPKTLAASRKTVGGKTDDKFPGIVLIHGGGGTAFSDWVWMWAERGYAAIAMDLSGRRPPAPRYDDQGVKIADYHHPGNQRIRLAKAGLDHTGVEKFQCIDNTIDNDWPYHAVANVMRAHTLIRSFESVDADRTAVTGISWGGYTTCLAASIDDRFKAAVPVYGCGFLHEGESVQKPAIDRLGEKRDAWVAAYDPSSHLSKCTVPTFWVNGTHDVHYVLDSYAKSYSLVRGPKTIRIEPNMRHSHTAGWAPTEIGIFVDSLLKDGEPLPEVGAMQVVDGTVTVPVKSNIPIRGVGLVYTSDSGPRAKRGWFQLEAKMVDGNAVAADLPEDANTWVMVVTDRRGAMVTSAVGMR